MYVLIQLLVVMSCLFSYYVKFIVLLFVITFCLYVLIGLFFLLQVIEQRWLVAAFS